MNYSDGVIDFQFNTFGLHLAINKPCHIYLKVISRVEGTRALFDWCLKPCLYRKHKVVSSARWPLWLVGKCQQIAVIFPQEVSRN